MTGWAHFQDLRVSLASSQMLELWLFTQERADRVWALTPQGQDTQSLQGPPRPSPCTSSLLTDLELHYVEQAG